MPGERKYGQDHGYYQWSPIVGRAPLAWPQNARVALCVIVNLEHYDWRLPPDAPVPVSVRGGPPPMMSGGRFPDICVFGQHEYGNRVGVFRVLDVLEKHGIRPTIAMDKAVADHYPLLVEECRRRGAEFIAHGLSARRIIHAGMSLDEERAYIHASVEALAKATGVRPAGWLGPDFQETVHTPGLLAAEGLRYVCDWGNDEQPYRMDVPQGELYSLGVNLHIEDVYVHWNGGRAIEEYAGAIRDEFDGLYADGAHNARTMVLNLHPWIMGVPWRIKYLDRALAHIGAHEGVWKATGSEIVESYAGQQKPARPAS